MANKSTTIVIAVLAVLLAVALGFIGYGYYSAAQLNQQNAIAQLGYQQAVVDIASLAAQCQQVPLVVGNQTINMIAVECLQLAQQSNGTQ